MISQTFFSTNFFKYFYSDSAKNMIKIIIIINCASKKGILKRKKLSAFHIFSYRISIVNLFFPFIPFLIKKCLI